MLTKTVKNEFFNLPQVSNCLVKSPASLDEFPDTLVLIHKFYSQYSKLHNLFPKSDIPNIGYIFQEMLVK